MSLVVRRRRRNEINVIPLIDVMVVLVFFLLLAGRFEQTHSLAIVPPSTTTGAALRSPLAGALRRPRR